MGVMQSRKKKAEATPSPITTTNTQRGSGHIVKTMNRFYNMKQLYTFSEFLKTNNLTNLFFLKYKKIGVSALFLGLSLHSFSQTEFLLDSSFNSFGFAVPNLDSGAYFNSCAVQTDGKIIAVGDYNNGIVVYRYLANGSLDNSFGTNGRFYVRELLTDPGDSQTGNKIALQSDGKILIAGVYSFNSSNPNSLYLMRLSTTGSIDNSFGTNGIYIIPVPNGEQANYCAALLVQSDNKIVVGGGSDAPETLLYRLTANGNLDTNFGAGGFYSSGDEQVDYITRKTNGNFLVNVIYNYSGKLLELDSTGTLLNTVITGSNGSWNQIQTNGKFIGSYASSLSGTAGYFDANRFNSDGTIDVTYNQSGFSPGTAEISLGTPFSSPIISYQYLQSDDKLLMIGSYEKIAIGRFAANGTKDVTLNTTGYSVIELAARTLTHGAARQSDGKYIICGEYGGYPNQLLPFILRVKETLPPITTGISEESNTDYVSKFYPNPLTSQAVITFTKEYTNATLKITNVLGKEVKNATFSGTQIIFERENLQNGIYFYDIISENKKIATGKLIVQ
jgi:uncharacterized delta-60 repeat protein